MKYEPDFSWIVWLADKTVVQVDGEVCRVEAGALIFEAGAAKRYAPAVFAPGEWKRVAVMSQLSGQPNGWTTMREEKPHR